MGQDFDKNEMIYRNKEYVQCMRCVFSNASIKRFYVLAIKNTKGTIHDVTFNVIFG